MSRGYVAMWSANSCQPFGDLMLNDLQFVCSYLQTRWQGVDISQTYGIFSEELPAIWVLLYPGHRKFVRCNVTAPQESIMTALTI